MSQELDIEGKKLEIVKYAYQRFYENGFHATSMEAALAGSGVSKRTLYKYFSSKEELVEAVLRLYRAGVDKGLFGPIEHLEDPREQIVALFDLRKAPGRVLTRGCLGMKAAQEYSGKHDRIVELGVEANACGEKRLLALCRQAGFDRPAALAKQLHLILQGALVLAHASGEMTPFASAKEVVTVLLDNAAPARRRDRAAKPAP